MNTYFKENLPHNKDSINELQKNINNIFSLKRKLEDYIFRLKNQYEYTHNNRDYIKTIEEEIKQLPMVNGSFLGYKIKKSLRRDIIKTLVDVCERIIIILNENKNKCNDAISNIQLSMEKQERLNGYKLFMETVYPYKKQYITGFDDIDVGYKGWNALVTLVEDGYITKDNIIDYGIDLSIPPE